MGNKERLFYRYSEHRSCQRYVPSDVGFLSGRAGIARGHDRTEKEQDIYIHVTVHRYEFLFNNQPDALIIQIYSVTKLYIFRASSLPIIRSSLLYIRHW